MGMPLLGYTVMDREIEESEIKAVPLMHLPGSSATVQRFEEMVGRILT